MSIAFAALPQPRPAHYEWGDPPRRENFLVIGVAIIDPVSAQAAVIHHATRLFVIRDDGRAAWLNVDALTFDDVEMRP